MLRQNDVKLKIVLVIVNKSYEIRKYINVSMNALYKMIIHTFFIFYSWKHYWFLGKRQCHNSINYENYFADCLERQIPDGTLTARHRGTTAAGIRVLRDKENPWWTFGTRADPVSLRWYRFCRHVIFRPREFKQTADPDHWLDRTQHCKAQIGRISLKISLN